ncbi:peptidase M24 (plasmid) [Ketogulonicigenium vulgare Y25]|uniref:Probable dipeptidase PepE n=1 Tax=Ketogulonicigenium vulgare (strain WSH-001) TaxID=759362 RepID=F9YBF3_KETVW|nr:Xaa-Pro peptidase family protein [Ketogulonicigenium vulgare]ADO44268.1 peptidase M24 [Ketogulonicigenium vulgare Y25]AEM42705.1 probable dipeptidase PepE [Ketogulonicigenium vulgare WSH-001]ALJ82845.1 peptidase M24 [Ketogulonicigenium vulgare]
MSIETRLSALRAKMTDTGADLVALGPGPNMHWVLGFHPHPDERPCLLLVTATGAGFLMPALNAADARARCDLPMWTWSDATGPQAALDQAIAALNASTTRKAAVDEAMRADFALLLLDALPQAKHAFAAETVGALRLVKDAAEMEELRMNSAIADEAMEAAFAALTPGMRESDLAQVVKDVFAKHGASPLFTIIGGNENGAYPHHSTSDRPLTQGDAIVIDIGARKGDFSSDITRMAVIGTPAPDYDKVHAVVEAAVQAALAAARPGVAAKVVDQAARQVITDAGYGEYFVHRTGHGMGLEGHEAPFITETSDTTLEAGMVFSIEPGIYLTDRFGIRLEEIVILHEDGPEVLSKLPRDTYRRS